jgi:hypothetical protein
MPGRKVKGTGTPQRYSWLHQTTRGSSVTILREDKPGFRHFRAQIEHIYGITRDPTAAMQVLDALKDGCVVLSELTEVAGTSVA